MTEKKENNTVGIAVTITLVILLFLAAMLYFTNVANKFETFFFGKKYNLTSAFGIVKPDISI